MKNLTVKVIAKVDQEVPKNLHISGFGSEDTTPIQTFKKDTEYTAKVVNKDNLVATGEDGVEYRIGGNADGKSFWRDWDFGQKFTMIDPPITCIETDEYEPIPDKPGIVRLKRLRTVNEVYQDVVRFLKEQDLYDRLDYFLQGGTLIDEKKEFPKWRWVMCYAVVGNSEGHYIHCDVTTVDGEHVHLFTGKTFSGMDFALEVSNALSKVFWDEFR